MLEKYFFNIVLWCGLLVVTMSSSVWAQSNAKLGNDNSLRPWVMNVSDKDRKRANKLFIEGNKLLDESVFVKAVDIYRQALTYWDHPAIQFNLALALVNMDQPIELYDALEGALRYGPEPLERQQFERARDYKTLIRQQIVWLEVLCNEPGARITANGKLLFVGPGRYEGWHLPGKLHIVATKAGYVTTDKTRLVGGGKTAKFVLKLYTPKELTRYRRRFHRPISWISVGVGIGLVASGGLLDWHGQQGIANYDAQIAKCGGCEPTNDQVALLRRSQNKYKAAIATYATGGALLAAGLVLVYLNRPRPYRIDEEQAAKQRRITPMLGPGAAGVNAVFQF